MVEKPDGNAPNSVDIKQLPPIYISLINNFQLFCTKIQTLTKGEN